MSELKLPEELKGPWDHALFLTYSVDVPFFENALWGQLSPKCRNRIILVDGQHYLDACASYAASGLVRYLNQQYLAEGVFGPHAAHAKLILLTNPERGRMLVGSGNLGWQGYASGGELFTQYEYSADEPDALNAFLAAREIIEGLFARRYVGSRAERHVHHLLETTPWVYQSPTSEWWPVRHNLTRSFLDQLQQAVAGEEVEELWVLSPFYDRQGDALSRLLTVFNPHHATLLVQPGWTSVDPTALEAVLDRFPSRCRVRSFRSPSDNPYVHAKLYLLKLPHRAICLQGSPNLSRAAMLLADPEGNIEVASLLTGPHHAFDGLLDALDLQPEVTRLDELDLAYQRRDMPAEQPSNGWQLIGGEWLGDRLRLRFRGAIPDLQGASLVIAGRSFSLEVRRQDPQGLEVRLAPDAVSLLGRPVPIALRWGDGDEAPASNPIFVCNCAALDAALRKADEEEKLRGVGGLLLDDEDFVQLLEELDAALVIDHRSIWQMAGRVPPPTADEDEEALRLDYADVDYEMLRRHPRLQQYLVKGVRGQAYTRSRLEVILTSITNHFRGLLTVSATARLSEAPTSALDQSGAETEEERQHEEEEAEKRRRTSAQRLRQILKNFVRRYLRGIRSPHFRELAGFEVMAQNYVIFSHILWRLFHKDWVEPQFVMDALLQTWRFFWGDGKDTGYFRELVEEQKSQLEQWLPDYHVEAEFFAAVYVCAHLANTETRETLRFDLRDFWREMLRSLPFPVTIQVLEETWHTVAELIAYMPPSPTAIVDELARLANLETRDSFLRGLENRYAYTRGTCAFEKQNVWRRSLGRQATVDCLVLRTEDALLDENVAIDILQGWMRLEDSDYYRIYAPASGRVLFYELAESDAVYWARDTGREPLHLGSIDPRPAAWDGALSQMRTVASELADRLDRQAQLAG